jgi:hypothetical protein
MVEGRDHLGGDSFIQIGPDDDRDDDMYVTRDRTFGWSCRTGLDRGGAELLAGSHRGDSSAARRHSARGGSAAIRSAF